MVKVSVWRDDGGQVVACEVTGHAGQGAKGQDIVCAAVSALTQTALLGLGQYAKAPLDYQVRQEPALLSFRLKSQPDGKTDAILETMLLGLAEIAKTHAGSLRLTER